MSVPQLDLVFERVDFEGGVPVLRVLFTDHRGEVCRLGFPLPLLEQMCQVCYDAVGGPPDTSKTGGVRTPAPKKRAPRASAEGRARSAFAVGMSISQLAAAVGISRSTASKWAAVLRIAP